MRKHKGLMSPRDLGKLYFSVGGFGFAVLFWHVFTWKPCGIDPDCFSRGDWPLLVWIGCIVFCVVLLIADSFLRGLFDD